VQFATFEKFEQLVCGQRKIAHREDYLPIGGLHWETHSESMLPQLANRRRHRLRLCVGKLHLPNARRLLDCFSGGPLSKTNRLFTEPPMHRQCVEFASQTCPFVSGKKLDYGDRPMNPAMLNMQEMVS